MVMHEGCTRSMMPRSQLGNCAGRAWLCCESVACRVQASCPLLPVSSVSGSRLLCMVAALILITIALSMRRSLNPGCKTGVVDHQCVAVPAFESARSRHVHEVVVNSSSTGSSACRLLCQPTVGSTSSHSPAVTLHHSYFLPCMVCRYSSLHPPQPQQQVCDSQHHLQSYTVSLLQRRHIYIGRGWATTQRSWLMPRVVVQACHPVHLDTRSRA